MQISIGAGGLLIEEVKRVCAWSAAYKQDSPRQAVGSVGMSPFPGASFLFLSHLQGVCLGMQLAVVEFSRNVLGWQGKCPLNNCSHPWRAQSLVPAGSLGAVEKDRPPGLSVPLGVH